MNVVLFGAGAIAREHVRAIRALQRTTHSDLRISGIYAPRSGAASTFAEEFNLPQSSADPRRFLDDPSIDAIIICSPSAMHAAQTEAAVRAGKHVLCEIPIALSLAEALALRELARSQQRTLMVAHTLRFEPALIAARHQIAGGQLRPSAIVARYLFLRRSNVGWTGYRRSWTDNLLWHHGGHVVDTALWLLGANDATTASLIAQPDPELGLPLDAGLVLRTSEGVLITIALSYNSAFTAHDYTIVGQETTLRASPGALLTAAGTPVAGIDLTGDAVIAQDDAFFTSIRTGQASPADIDAILPSLRVLHQAAHAADLGPSAEEQHQAAAERARLDSARSL